MKVLTILWLLLLAPSVFGQLTKEELRQIVREEVQTIVKEEISASEKRIREYVDLKFETANTKIDGLDKRFGTKIDGLDKRFGTKIDGLDKRFDIKIDELDKRLNIKIEELGKRLDIIFALMIALIALITAAIAIPQIIIAFKQKGESELKAELEQLRQKVEALEQSRLVKP